MHRLRAPNVRRFLPCIPLTLILVATGALWSATLSVAADARWVATGAQAPGQADKPVWSVAVSRAHPALLLAATQGRGILRSADAGSTWVSVTPAVDAAWVVRFDPTQPTVASAGTQTDGFLQ